MQNSCQTSPDKVLCKWTTQDKVLLIFTRLNMDEERHSFQPPVSTSGATQWNFAHLHLVGPHFWDTLVAVLFSWGLNCFFAVTYDSESVVSLHMIDYSFKGHYNEAIALIGQEVLVICAQIKFLEDRVECTLQLKWCLKVNNYACDDYIYSIFVCLIIALSIFAINLLGCLKQTENKLVQFWSQCCQ